MHYLTLEQVLDLAELATGESPAVRDLGLLESAVQRPQTSLFGEDAYPDVLTKAAALLHSLASNRALVDGNKRLAWIATDVFCRYTGTNLEPTEDEAYDLVVAIAAGKITEVADIAQALQGVTDVTR